jgi:hypothetical protein
VEAFSAKNAGFCVKVGENIFSEQGIDLHVEEEGLSLRGKLHYGLLTPPPGDVMGAFRLVPGLECVHGVLSLGHRLAGSLTIQGQTVDFTDGLGYIECDRGRSFPRRYLWSQCAWEDVRVMGAVATVPWKGWQFTGCTCLVAQAGRVLRLATDKGARVERWDETGAVVRQGRYRLSMEYLTGQSLPLQAPVGGGMNRCVQECLQALVRYRLERGRTCLFDHTDPWASFEQGKSGESMGL